jgi:2-hydroxychromene-2-carboxylate isomerase
LKQIDYWFTPVSPWTYLGNDRFHALARRFGAEIAYRPVDFGRIFPASGGLPLGKRAPQRQAYRLVELRRWSEFLGLPLILEPRNFPQPDEPAALTLIAADEAGVDMALLTSAVMRALWAEDRPLADWDTLRAVLVACGLDPALTDRAKDPEIRARRDSFTEQAIAAGVFGAPTYVLDGEMFWGQDRLDFLERALSLA